MQFRLKPEPLEVSALMVIIIQNDLGNKFVIHNL